MAQAPKKGDRIKRIIIRRKKFKSSPARFRHHFIARPNMPKTKTQKIISKVGKELKKDPPRIVAKTRRAQGDKKATAQLRAILLSKARKRGARIKRA